MNALIAMEYVNGIGNRGEARINLNEGASSVKKKVEGRPELMNIVLLCVNKVGMANKLHKGN